MKTYTFVLDIDANPLDGCLSLQARSDLDACSKLTAMLANDPTFKIYNEKGVLVWRVVKGEYRNV